MKKSIIFTLLFLCCAFHLNAQQRNNSQKKHDILNVDLNLEREIGDEIVNGDRVRYYNFTAKFTTKTIDYARQIDQSGNTYTIVCGVWNDKECTKPFIAKGQDTTTAKPYYIFFGKNVKKLLNIEFQYRFPLEDLINNLRKMYGANYIGGKPLYYKVQLFKGNIDIADIKNTIPYFQFRVMPMVYQYLYIQPKTFDTEGFSAGYNIPALNDYYLDKINGYTAKVSIWHDIERRNPVNFYLSTKRKDSDGEYVVYAKVDGVPDDTSIIERNYTTRHYKMWENSIYVNLTHNMIYSDMPYLYKVFGKRNPSPMKDTIYAFVDLYDDKGKLINFSYPSCTKILRIQRSKLIFEKNKDGKGSKHEIYTGEKTGGNGCNHEIYTRKKTDITEPKRILSPNQCTIREDVEYKVEECCHICLQKLPEEDESDSQVFDNPEAPESCITEYCDMTTDYKNEGNKIITIQKIFIENSEGERNLVETRTRTSANNQNEECPPHDMTKIGNNLYKCKKCNITRYGEEENFYLVKNNHAVSTSKCTTSTISKNINGVNFVFQKAIIDDKKEKAIYVGETEVTEAMWMAIFPNHRYELNKTSKAAIDMIPYEDAKMFISMLNYLSAKEGWKLKFFLPTIEEWVMAFHAGGKCNDGWLAHNSCKIAMQVGLKPANNLHVYDMKGNVAEMCNEVLARSEDDGTYNKSYLTTFERGRRNHDNVYAGNNFLDDINEVGPTDVRVTNISIGRNGIGFRVFAVPE